ncbi:hypothetical protein BDN72DRAFT_959143 [Pluteus cervinus]|uniref:Uncharacterized protein n=1 Tax=Pluteus cervinus TaxID=181527 RepID=A0ACD3AW92_9AGAR|nr:hypothetical protein BDN72DRAFT_959143 [Pluteus cervinus]
MGQRHQAYIIARVIPYGSNKPNYRCIGAIHHQWCYGSLPLKAALRFMALIKPKENAEVIEQEVKALNGKYGSHLRQPPAMPSVPCPFTSFLMTSAWSIDLAPAQGKDAYLSHSSDEDASMQMLEGDNNDGVTVIDISNLNAPSYCFILHGGDSPITAEQYIRDYYPMGSRLGVEEELVASALPPFVGIPVIPIQHLAEAWPTEFFARKEEAPVSEPTPHTMPTEVPHLADLMLGPALDQALRNNNQEELSQLLFPHKVDQILAFIRTQNPMPDGGVFLLANILNVKDQKIVNLTGFHLSSQQILSLLPVDSSLVEVIDISHNHAVRIDAVEQMLTRYQTLRRLVLLDTHIPEDDVLALLKYKPELFYHIDAFVHPVFMKPQRTNTNPDAYTHIIFTGNSDPGAPTSILRALLHFTRMMESKESSMRMYPSTVARAAYASENLADGQKWGERIIPYVPRLQSCKQAMSDVHPWKLFFWPSYSSTRYAFLKTKPEAMLEYLGEYESLRERHDQSTISEVDFDEKIEELASSFKSRLFRVYDVRGFFEQLDLEGRPAPPRGELEKLYNNFTALQNGDGHLKLMNQEDIHEFLINPCAWYDSGPGIC